MEDDQLLEFTFIILPHEYHRLGIISREPDKCAKNITSKEKQPKKREQFFFVIYSQMGGTEWISDKTATSKGFKYQLAVSAGMAGHGVCSKSASLNHTQNGRPVSQGSPKLPRSLGSSLLFIPSARGADRTVCSVADKETSLTPENRPARSGTGQ
jgi:hypothetical protein